MAALPGFMPALALLVALPMAASAHHDISSEVFSDRQDEAAHTLRLDLPAPETSEHGASPDAAGLRRDTYYFFGGQFLVIAGLYYGPEALSGWSEEQKKEYSFKRYRRNVANITVDNDRWWVNYVLHPYWGGTYYVRARERGYGDDDAFWYAVMLSILYEYGSEALFEEPSVQDLIFTPAFGYFVGGYFMNLRADLHARVAAGQSSPMTERTVRLLTDPIGAMSSLIDSALGIEGQLAVAPFFVREQPAAMSADARSVRDTVSRLLPGMHVYLTW